MKVKKSRGLPFLAFFSVLVLCLTLMPTAALADTSQSSTRLAGADRYETAVQISQNGWPGTSDYAVLAAGMDANLIDSLSSALLAKVYNAPILLTQGDSLNASTEAELKRLKVSTVFLTTGTGVIKPAVFDKLEAMGITVNFLGGADRFETGVNIAKEIAKKQAFNKIVVTTGWSNADALSMAPIAASQGMPILLTDTNTMPASVANYINSIKDSLIQVYVIGGTGAISDSVISGTFGATAQASTSSYTAQGSSLIIIRIGGADRYATNLAILRAFANILLGNTVYVANGTDSHLVDALIGATLVGRNFSAIILVDSNGLTNDIINHLTQYYKNHTIVILGGIGSISDDIVNQIIIIIVPPANGGGGGASWQGLNSATVNYTNSANPGGNTISGVRSGSDWIFDLTGISDNSTVFNGGTLNAVEDCTLIIGTKSTPLVQGSNNFAPGDAVFNGIKDQGPPGVTLATLKSMADVNGNVNVSATIKSNVTNHQQSITFHTHVTNLNPGNGTNSIESVQLNTSSGTLPGSISGNKYTFDLSKIAGVSKDTFVQSATFTIAGEEPAIYVVAGKTFDLTKNQTIAFGDLVNDNGNNGVKISTLQSFADSTGSISVNATINGVSVVFKVTGLNKI